MKKKNNHKNKTPSKTTKEDSIDVSTANAENRFTWKEARQGITNLGGNASADIRIKGGKNEDDSQLKNNTKNSANKKKQQSGVAMVISAKLRNIEGINF